jgi:hypothetical protein
MKISELILIIWGEWSKLEPEPEFLTSRSRAKMDKTPRCSGTDNPRVSPNFRLKRKEAKKRKRNSAKKVFVSLHFAKKRKNFF